MTQISRLIGLYQKHNLYGDSYWWWAISFDFDSQKPSLLIIPDIHYENFSDEYWNLSVKIIFMMIKVDIVGSGSWHQC